MDFGFARMAAAVLARANRWIGGLIAAWAVHFEGILLKSKVEEEVPNRRVLQPSMQIGAGLPLEAILWPHADRACRGPGLRSDFAPRRVLRGRLPVPSDFVARRSAELAARYSLPALDAKS